MREILFRGKDNSGVLNHSWCFGSLDTILNEEPTIIYPDRFGNRCKIIVKEHTIGQYTGLTDKNGKKIFEGDIVEFESHGYIPFKQRGVVVFKDYLFCISYDYYGPRFQNFIKSEIVDDGPASIPVTYTFEVIGNIHDNPLMLVRSD